VNLLDRYIWKNALGGILIAWLSLLMLDSFFSLVNELEDTGDGKYTVLEAILYIIYTLPQRLYEYFPTSILVGALLGLGKLSSNSEFTAMRAAGVSIMQITFATLQLGIFLALMAFVLGEWVIPVTDRYASHFKASQTSNKIAITEDRALWIKEKKEIIHIDKVLSREHLAGIRIYRISDNHRQLSDLTTIESARYVDNKWELHKVVTRIFKDKQVINDAVDKAYTETLVSPDILEVTVAEPDHLSSKQLSKLIEHQQKNGLSSDKLELAFWKHYSIPLSALVMLMLAMPFLFASQRSANTGQRVFIGIVVGITFFLLNNVLNEVGTVYNMPALVSAFFPVLLFLVVSLLALKRIT